jgi:hypothetical protein
MRHPVGASEKATIFDGGVNQHKETFMKYHYTFTEKVVIWVCVFAAIALLLIIAFE